MIHQHKSLLQFESARYLKVSLLLCCASIGAYAWYGSSTVYLKPYGGTWLGYTLGTVAAVLILWLMLLGIRKRRYQSNIGSVQGWTSAHVYLGTSLIIIATLHCGFEFGWNIHTLAYALMMLVIVSGFFGVFSYLRYPERMTKNQAGETLETTLLKIADLESKCKRMVLDLPDEFNALFAKASWLGEKQLALNGSLWRQLAGTKKSIFAGNLWHRLTGIDRRHPMRVARDEMIKMDAKFTAHQAKSKEQLIVEMSRTVELMDRVRRHLQLRAMMQVWLYFHVPLSFALLAALTAHVISVFYFW